MSKINISIPLSCLFVGFLFLPYNEIISIPVFVSILLLIFSPASASPLNPCSGEKIFLMSIFKEINESN